MQNSENPSLICKCHSRKKEKQKHFWKNARQSRASAVETALIDSMAKKYCVKKHEKLFSVFLFASFYGEMIKKSE